MDSIPKWPGRPISFLAACRPGLVRPGLYSPSLPLGQPSLVWFRSCPATKKKPTDQSPGLACRLAAWLSRNHLQIGYSAAKKKPAYLLPSCQEKA